mmetsp:Transcript_12429/g.34883  ORF Transcript_12429/g.34883 Transcript_12429/m.34883 type:complete len:220 (-) Transcript_12429:795-1454(-)
MDWFSAAVVGGIVGLMAAWISTCSRQPFKDNRGSPGHASPPPLPLDLPMGAVHEGGPLHSIRPAGGGTVLVDVCSSTNRQCQAVCQPYDQTEALWCLHDTAAQPLVSCPLSFCWRQLAAGCAAKRCPELHLFPAHVETLWMVPFVTLFALHHKSVRVVWHLARAVDRHPVRLELVSSRLVRESTVKVLVCKLLLSLVGPEGVDSARAVDGGHITPIVVV